MREPRSTVVLMAGFVLCAVMLSDDDAGAGFCGDGFCDPQGGEDSDTCPTDCECGDQVCDTAEDQEICCLDCGCPAGQECTGNNCVGNGNPDYFVNAIDLGSAVGVGTTGNNDGFTGEVGEPAQSGPITSAWWRWTASSNGYLTVDTFGSAFDTVLTVATGGTVASLAVVAQNDDAATGEPQSKVILAANPGVTYHCAVDGRLAETGDITLNLSLDTDSNDSNDWFANAIDLGSAGTANATGNNDGYTVEAGEPAQSGPITSAWWRWTAPSNGCLTVDTFGSAFDTVLTVATGGSVASLTVVAQNDDCGTLQSQAVLSVLSGATYHCAVDGYNASTGDVVLNLSFGEPEDPPCFVFGDDFESCDLSAWLRLR